MSQSIINSSLFMINPLAEISSEDHDIYKYKGSNPDNISNTPNNSKLPVYEKISDTEDIYLIRTENGSFEYHRKNLIETLTELHNSAHVPVSQLNDSQTALLASTTEVTRILYNSNALKDLIMKDVQNIFSDIKNPIPGTVAAFFVGCFNDDKFTGPIGCNPRCAASSLLKCDGENFECSDTILIFSNNQFRTLNKNKSNKAYIYIQSPTFTMFSPNNIQNLKDSGIQSAILIYGNKDGSYREVTGEMSIDKLPVSRLFTTTNTWAGPILFLILLVIIIIIAFLSIYGKPNI